MSYHSTCYGVRGSKPTFSSTGSMYEASERRPWPSGEKLCRLVGSNSCICLYESYIIRCVSGLVPQNQRFREPEPCTEPPDGASAPGRSPRPSGEKPCRLVGSNSCICLYEAYIIQCGSGLVPQNQRFREPEPCMEPPDGASAPGRSPWPSGEKWCRWA